MRALKLVVLIIPLFIFSLDAFATTSTITWNPAPLTQTILIGTTSSVQVSFTSQVALSHVRIRINSDLARFASVSPSVFNTIPAGAPQTLTITFAVPRGTRSRAIAGSLRLIVDNNESEGRNEDRDDDDDDEGPSFRSRLSVNLHMERVTSTEIPASPAMPSANRLASPSDSNLVVFVKDEIDIFFKPGVPVSTITDFVGQLGGVFLGSIPAVNFYQVQVPQEGFETLSAVIDQVNQNPNVLFATHHCIGHETGTPSDPGTSGSYILPMLHLPEAWDITTGKRSTGPNNTPLGIGIIDSSFNFLHPDLSPNVIGRPVNTGAPLDHGTATASIVGAQGNNGTGIAGVMWRASLSLYSVGTPTTPTGPDDALVNAALLQAILDNQRVVNLSFATNCPPAGCSPSENKQLAERDREYKFFFDYANSLGIDVLWVCSGVNRRMNQQLVTPARLSQLYPNVISVSAVDTQGRLASFSSYGSSVTVAAPGVNIPVLTPSGSFQTQFGGTSAAAPLVTGVAGLMLSVNPTLSASQLKSIIQQTASRTGRFDPDGNEVRILDALASVSAAQVPQTVWLSFVEGNPHVPGDGSLINSSDAFAFHLENLVPLGSFTSGMTISVFPPPNSDRITAINFTVFTQKPNLNCSLFFGSGINLSGTVTTNGVQGVYGNLAPSMFTQLVDTANQLGPGCNFTIDNLSLTNLYMPTTTAARPTVNQVIAPSFLTTMDAAAIGAGQNNIPGPQVP